jgi:hypothetical protein
MPQICFGSTYNIGNFKILELGILQSLQSRRENLSAVFIFAILYDGVNSAVLEDNA